MRIQSTHPLAARKLDAYWTPPEAIWSLLALESVPRTIWEPAAGNGAIVRVLEAAGHVVHASDIEDYGAGFPLADYLTAAPPAGVEAVVTNPPFRRAIKFVRKALGEVPFVALLLRTNFLEAQRRYRFFQQSTPARVWISPATPGRLGCRRRANRRARLVRLGRSPRGRSER